MKKANKKFFVVADGDDREETTPAGIIPLTKSVVDFEKKMKIFEERQFAITVNPAEQFCSSTLNVSERLSALHKSTVNRLALVLNDVYDSIVLYPDISLPREIYSNRIPRVHYHGIITIKKEKKKMMKFILGLGTLAQWFSIEIDTIDNLDVWTKYITKGVKVFPTNVENFEVITDKSIKEAHQVMSSTQKAKGLSRELTSFIELEKEEPEGDEIAIEDN